MNTDLVLQIHFSCGSFTHVSYLTCNSNELVLLVDFIVNLPFFRKIEIHKSLVNQ